MGRGMLLLRRVICSFSSLFHMEFLVDDAFAFLLHQAFLSWTVFPGYPLAILFRWIARWAIPIYEEDLCVQTLRSLHSS